MLGSCGVIGYPLGHSLSPFIHQTFAAQFEETLRYTRFEVLAFDTVVTRFFADAGTGLNVTLPYKEAAFDLVVESDTLARQAGAVNTLFQKNGVLHGTNTDGVGLVQDLTENLGLPLAGRRILILGAGGAVRGILGPLLSSGAEEIVLWNRTAARAEQLVGGYSNAAPGSTPVRLFRPGRRRETGADLVIHATSAGLNAELPEIEPEQVAGSLCYDLMYGEPARGFREWAQAAGAQAVYDGLGMLVCQAALSFRIWHGLEPDIPSVLEQVRQRISNAQAD